MKKYLSNIFSQFGEDGIIEECLKRINPAKKVCIEFGGHDGYFCSNTRHLINLGWKGYLYDITPGSPDVFKSEITPDNVNGLPECTLLSIDIDGNDYNVWKAYKGSPDIVIIEINSSVEPDAMSPVSDLNHGTGYLPMKLLGESKGYFLLIHTGNMIFILDKYKHLFPDADETFKTDWL